MDLMDQSFVVADRAAIARAVRDPVRWRTWWPQLRLTVHEDRGEQGVRWVMSGALVGTAEVWLEPVRDGAVVHLFVKGDPTQRGSDDAPMEGSPRRRAKAAAQHAQDVQLAWKRAVAGLKDELEAGRPLGVAREAPDAG